MLKKIHFLFFIFLCLVFTSTYFVMSQWDEIFLRWTFGDSFVVWEYNSGWNAGRISFDDTPPEYSWARIVWYGGSEVTLTGIFWIESVWWASFSENPVILSPPSLWQNVRDPWYLSWYAWSPNAWWIALNHGESYASWVAFFPDSWSLGWYGYSHALWWIPFGSGIIVDINEWFIGKVAVIGAIWWSKTFNVLYDVGGTFNTASMISLVNLVRKNVSILTRNASIQINTSLLGAWVKSFNKAMIFRIENNPSSEFLPFSRIKTTFDNNLDRSLIVIGADIYIDTDITPPSFLDQPRAIIALRNERGDGGNIWIKWNVKRIESVLVSERSIFSWEEFITGTLSPYYISKRSLFLDIPRTQLYIRWAIAGFNTIWWSSKDGGAVCPYLGDQIEICTYDSAIKYDWNYFRIYNGSLEWRAYLNQSRDSFSTIIEYDARTIRDPPPWLETLN